MRFGVLARCAIVVVWASLSGWADAQPDGVTVDAARQAQVAQLIQNGIHQYWHGGDPQRAEATLFKGITVKGRYDAVEEFFRRAAQIYPERLDLRAGTATAQLLQRKFLEALQTYEQAWLMDTSGFDMGIQFAAYARALHIADRYQQTMQVLQMQHPERTREYQDKFERLERVLKTPVNTVIGSASVWARDDQFIVVFGYLLRPDGSPQPELVRRLERALALARTYPQSKIVLSGGVPHSGVTEALAMSQWLLARGISRKRLLLEDQSKDTVGNAIYTVAMLSRLGVRRATLVSSASHIRRARVAMEEAAYQLGMALQLKYLTPAEPGNDDEYATAKEPERVLVYRDLLRVSGLWSFPGIQR